MNQKAHGIGMKGKKFILVVGSSRSEHSQKVFCKSRAKSSHKTYRSSFYQIRLHNKQPKV